MLFLQNKHNFVCYLGDFIVKVRPTAILLNADNFRRIRHMYTTIQTISVCGLSAVDTFGAAIGDTAYCGHKEPSTTNENYDIK